jgi:3-hydroxybutyryl-CoA dehydrogenase
MPVRSVGVIGSGTMGAGIAQVVAVSGFKVALLDVNEDALSKAMGRIGSGFDRLLKKGALTQDAAAAARTRISTGTDYASLGSTDLVIEAATENPEIKMKIMKVVDQTVRADTIISSTTSSVSITKLASAVSNPTRFIGLHFFNPVPVMNLIEIVRGLQTADATHDIAVDFAKSLGKMPITVKNTPGFVVNRLLIPMMNEAFFALEDGDATPEDIDEGMKLGCNHPIGPLALADLIGLDVLLAVMVVLHRDFGDPKYRPAPKLREMVDAGFLGRKSGQGIYHYGTR